jgi:uncharacterized SAM-binding protein YcdF (DUF218 family)
MTSRIQRRGGKIWVGITIAGLLSVIALANSAKWLVVDHPRKSDVIIVLAGETDFRPALALELLRSGYGRLAILDVPADATIYQWTQADLAQKYVQSLPEAGSIKICLIHGLSTKEEADEAGQCLADSGSRRVLLVTSDFHTWRALNIFRARVPKYEYSVAAAHNRNEFGLQWWQHREWAKTNFYEWLRLAWWELVDRWR